MTRLGQRELEAQQIGECEGARQDDQVQGELQLAVEQPLQATRPVKLLSLSRLRMAISSSRSSSVTAVPRAGR